MSALGVGDWVECVKPASRRGFAVHTGDVIVIGAIYQVRAVVAGVFADKSGGDGLFLHGITSFGRNGREGAWAVECFKLIYRPKQSIIEALKAPPQRVGEPA